MINEWYWMRDGTYVFLYHKTNVIMDAKKERCIPNYIARSMAEMYSYIASH